MKISDAYLFTSDEKNSTISITPKKPQFLNQQERQFSEQLEGIFPDIDETIKKESETFKERSRDIDEISYKHGKSSDSETSDQVTFQFETFTGGTN